MLDFQKYVKFVEIDSLKYVQEFYTPVSCCRDISIPLNMTRHKTKRDWLLNLSVIWPLGRSLAIQSGQGSQTFCHQSEGLLRKTISWQNDSCVTK